MSEFIRNNIKAFGRTTEGVAVPLKVDSAGRLVISNIPGSLLYKGTWDAATNTPTLSNDSGGGVAGDYYVVGVSGSTTIDTETDWLVGDWIISNGTVWQKADHTDVVSGIGTSTDNAITRYDGTTGNLIQNSGVTIDDSNNVSGVIDLEAETITDLDYIDFNTSLSPTLIEGRVGWANDSGTISIGLPGGNVAQAVGQEIYLPRKVKNVSGVDIKNGNLVYISGGSGVNAYVTIASNDSLVTADRTIAMATEDIDDDAFGYATTFGIVKGDAVQNIDTSGGSPGEKTYLGLNGAFTVTKPTAPARVVCVGTIFRSHATEGWVFVNIEVDKQQMARDVTEEPTGFFDNDSVIVTGDSTTRTVTLTGTVEGYYKGDPVETLVSGWTSPAHDNVTTNQYFLIYNGSDFVWGNATSIGEDFFKNLWISYAFYNSTDGNWVYLRETHGLNPWQAHKEFHEVVGTYKKSGGDFSNYTLSSTTAADRRPDISSSLIYDEDLPTTNAALTNNTYAQYYLSSTDTPNFITAGTDIVPLSGNQPYYNELTGGVYQQTLLPVGDYMIVWVIALPMAADTNSQKIRYVFGQGQEAFDNLIEAQAKQFAEWDAGQLSNLSPESVAIGKIIIRYIGGNWSISELSKLEGTRVGQTTVTGGGVTTFTGLGDTPSTYTSQALKLLNVNSGTTALEFGLTAPANTGTIALSSGLSGGQTINGGTASGDGLNLYSTSNATKGAIIIDNSTALLINASRSDSDTRIDSVAAVGLAIFDAGVNRVSIGGGATPTIDAKVDIVQGSAAANIPVLKLQQDDVSEEFIDFATTIGTGNGIEAIGAKTITTTHALKISINGTEKWIAVGDLA